jgi:hypothetical protein
VGVAPIITTYSLTPDVYTQVLPDDVIVTNAVSVLDDPFSKPTYAPMLFKHSKTLSISYTQVGPSFVCEGGGGGGGN